MPEYGELPSVPLDSIDCNTAVARGQEMEDKKGSTHRSGRHVQKRQNQEVTELVMYAANLSSIMDVPRLAKLHGLCRLTLHGNKISVIEGLSHLTHLTELNLSSNSIEKIGGLGLMRKLTHLNLATNRIRSIEGLDTLKALQVLNLAFNSIHSLKGLDTPHGPRNSLKVLDVRGNRIAHMTDVQPIAALRSLVELRVSTGNAVNQGTKHRPRKGKQVYSRNGENPIVFMPKYRAAIVRVLPGLQTLDGTLLVQENPEDSTAKATSQPQRQPSTLASLKGRGGRLSQLVSLRNRDRGVDNLALSMDKLLESNEPHRQDEKPNSAPGVFVENVARRRIKGGVNTPQQHTARVKTRRTPQTEDVDGGSFVVPSSARMMAPDASSPDLHTLTHELARTKLVLDQKLTYIGQLEDQLGKQRSSLDKIHQKVQNHDLEYAQEREAIVKELRNSRQEVSDTVDVVHHLQSSLDMERAKAENDLRYWQQAVESERESAATSMESARAALSHLEQELQHERAQRGEEKLAAAAKTMELGMQLEQHKAQAQTHAVQRKELQVALEDAKKEAERLEKTLHTAQEEHAAVLEQMKQAQQHDLQVAVADESARARAQGRVEGVAEAHATQESVREQLAQTEKDFRTALQEGATEMKALKEEKAQADKEVSELKDALRKTLEKEGKLENLLAELSQALRDQKKQAMAFQTERDDMMSLVNEAMKRKENLELTVQQLERELRKTTSFEAELNTARAELKRAQEQIQRASVDELGLAQKEAQLLLAQTQHEGKVQKMAEEIKVKTTQLEDQMQTILELKKTNNDLKAKSDHGQTASLEKRLRHQDDTIAKLELKVSVAEEAQMEAEEERRHLHHKLKEYSDTVAQMEEEIREKTAEYDSQKDALKQEYEACREKAEKLESALAVQHSLSEKLRKEVEDARQERKDAEDCCQRRVATVEAEMRDLIAAAEEQRREYNAKVTRLNTVVDVLQAETLGPLPRVVSLPSTRSA
eukprot:scaffold2088_cov399-Prasinococcus_capsulatus_cf.AAC.44